MNKEAVIIDYPGGNVRSVIHALNRLGWSAVVSSNRLVIAGAERVIFPGVGEASTAMDYLRKSGLDEVIISLSQPVLGICLGMQLLNQDMEEGNTTGLGIFPAPVLKFRQDFKVPHVGWNMVSGTMAGQGWTNSEKYFVHSYYVPVNEFTVATTSHGIPFSSVIRKGNFSGVQFHPEKSGQAGAELLKRFLTDGGL